MFNPETISEHLMYATTKIITPNGNGTGFIFQFEGTNTPIIITNKHVVNYKDKEDVTFYLHEGISGKPNGKKIDISLEVNWISHKEYDLCFCFLGPVLNSLSQKSIEVFFQPLNNDIIPDGIQLQELNVIEDVIMIGYPNGLMDNKNNFPLIRKGITSTHPCLDYDGKKVGAIDIAAFPGSSGSPIFILHEGSYSDKKGNTFLGGSKFLFLGILYAGPQFTSQGSLVVQEIPTTSKVSTITPIMMNLGYYIKSEEILYFKSIVKKMLGTQ